MKKPVMQRKMFANGGQATSEGILSGFNNETEDGYEDRTPENIEIIANNLRGDMRSLDERYLELAQLVGEAAFDTPEEVVALMQTQLGAATSTMGLESLGAPETPDGGITEGFGAPEEGMMQPEMGMAPEGMPEMGTMPPEMGMAPPQEGMMPPVGMADGGIVHLAKGGMPSNWATSLLEGIGKLDDAATARFAQAMQTGAPVTAAGNPIPFVDKSGRMYQPVGGTNPNMASRGMPMPSKFNPLRFATKFGGPAALLGGYAADALLASDANKGTIPGSMFESELGLPYPEVEMPQRPQSFEDMPGTPEQKAAVRSAGFQDLTPRLGLANLGAEPPASEEAAPAPATAPRATDIQAMLAAGAKKEPGESEKSFRDRVKEKMGIYSEFLGSDPEMRKAQALFLLAEAALNVAGAKGRSTGERLATGLKGFPAGMAALGAEAEKERRGVAAAAIQAVEAEDTAKNKAIADLVKAQANKKPGKADQISGVLQARFGMPEGQASLLANEMDAGLVEIDKDTGEAVDKLNGSIRFSPHRPLAPTSVGYLDPQNPFVQTLATELSPAPISERKDKLSRRTELQKSIARNEQMLGDIYGDAVGFLPTVQSGVSRLFLATVGDSPFLLTDVAKNQIRQNLQLNRESILKSNLRNAGRPSVYDQTKIEGLIEDPNKLFASPELVVSSVSNFIREDLNELARLDSELFGTPVRQMGRIPTGSASDPIPIGPNSQLVLQDIFTKRPKATIWTSYTNREGKRVTGKMTAADYFAQSRGQAQ